jgi:hypothetical protein
VRPIVYEIRRSIFREGNILTYSKVILQVDRAALHSGVSEILFVNMRSRDRIKEILRAAGKPMTPKEVWDGARLSSRPMNYSAIRKLLRDMMRIDVRCPRKGQYCLIDDLSEKEINAAPAKEFYEGLVALIESHRRQRRTTAADFIRGLEKALNEERAKFGTKQTPAPETHGETDTHSEN